MSAHAKVDGVTHAVVKVVADRYAQEAACGVLFVVSDGVSKRWPCGAWSTAPTTCLWCAAGRTLRHAWLI